MKLLGRLALGILPLLSSVLSQSSTAFTDPINGITFQAYTSAADGGKVNRLLESSFIHVRVIF